MPALALPTDSLRELMLDRGITTRAAALRDSSINDEERSFEAVVATPTRAQVIDWERYEVIDEILLMRGGNFPNWAPLLPNHRRYDVLDVIGSADQFRLSDEQWAGRGIVAEPATEDDEVRKIWSRVAQRHIRAVSIGYRVHNSVDIPPGKTAEINGKRFKAEQRVLRVSTEWQVHELSLTPIGADSMALIRSHQGQRRPQKRSYFR